LSDIIADKNFVFPYGEAILSNGLEVRDAVNGYGLVSRGFLWQLYDIWLDITASAPLVTSWSNSQTSITTIWSNIASSSIVTAWTPTQFGVYGEYSP
jgi:hypothetical protein